MKLRVLVALGALAALAACATTPGHGTTQGKTTVTDPPRATSTSPTPTPTATTSPPDGYAIRQAAAGPTAALMLFEPLMKKAGFTIRQQRAFFTDHGWFQQCGGDPNVGQFTLGWTTEQWELKSSSVLEEDVVAFVPPGATDAMRIIKKRYNACSSYTLDHDKLHNIKAVALPKARFIDDQVAWCQDGNGTAFTLCVAEYRRGDKIVQLWAATATKSDGLTLLGVATAALGARIAPNGTKS